MTFENKDFVHFHTHSEYSQFDGLAKIDNLVLQARKMGFPALALTDHGNIMGWIKFLQQCRVTQDKKGNDIPYPPIKPILGCEFYLARKMDIGQYEEKRDTKKTQRNQPDGRRGNRHLNLYAMNFEGYKNLCKMSQRSFTDGFYFDPRVDVNLLAAHSKGIMCGSACLSSVINANLMYGNYGKAKKICTVFKDIFEDNFFLEVMYHGIKEEKEIVPLIFKLSSELNIPIICTNDSHYIKNDEGDVQEVLLCMSQQRCIKDPARLQFNHMEFYLKSADDMYKIFGSSPSCLTNSLAMAERVNTKDIEENIFGGMILPKFDVPSEYKNSYDYLCALAWEGIKKVGWENSKEHVDRLKMELQDVLVAKESNNYDFSTYFLIVRDYIKYANENSILVGCGRGSGYASVLLRCLDITYGVDPLKYGLLWERFLGFDDLRFIKEADFGFDVDVVQQAIEKDASEEVEEDLGGIERY